MSTIAPKWFGVVTSAALIWNVLGLAAFGNQMTMDLSQLPGVQRDFYQAIPLWATVAFAVAVSAGVIGCIALLMRKRAAPLILAISLLGILVQVFHSLILAGGFQIFGTAGLLVPLLTISIAILLVLFARHATIRKWLT